MKSLFLTSLLVWAALATDALAAAPPERAVAAPAAVAASPRLDQPIPLGAAASGAASRYAFALPHGLRLQLAAGLLGTVEEVGASQLDAAGTLSSSHLQLSPLLRVGLRLEGPKAPDSLSYALEYEQDLPTGSVTAALPEGAGMPGGAGLTTELRKAFLQLALGNKVLFRGGVMTSDFGLGLVANDGTHGWEPGSARFADPRGGDRVLRALVATGPHTRFGLVAALAVDKVLHDDTLLLSQEMGGAPAPADDTARQFVGLLSLGNPAENWAGLFVAQRNQSAADGRTLAATVASLSGLGRHKLASGGTLSGGFEGAFITGETNLPGTPSNPQQQLRQAALALRGGLDLTRFGFAFDALAASGDANLADDQQTAFRANPNYDLGLLLFPQVLAAQSARSSFTAGNPALVGEPAPGVERLPTRGAATNTFTVFPRAFVRPLQGVEVYGGPLFAWSAVPPVDPFNTAIDGGSLRNALGGKPGNYLGTELDLGARARFASSYGELDLGIEGGLLFPGDALNRADGTPLPAVPGARAMLALRL